MNNFAVGLGVLQRERYHLCLGRLLSLKVSLNFGTRTLRVICSFYALVTRKR